MKLSELKNAIQEIIKEKLSVDEMTVTGNVAGYNTPFAFSKNSKGNVKAAEMVGYKLVKELIQQVMAEMALEEENKKSDLKEGRGRYYNLREHPMKAPSKVSVMIQEVNKMLKEIEYLTDLNIRLKKESNVGPDMYWKRTNEHFRSINERMKRVSRKLEYLKR